MIITRTAGGFTLIELLLVMVLIALMAGIAAPRFSAWMEGVQTRGTLTELTTWLEAQPTEAFLAGNGHTLEARDAPPLPAHWRLEMDPAPSYEANGMAAGGRVLVWDGNRLLADWEILPPTGIVNKNPAP